MASTATAYNVLDEQFDLYSPGGPSSASSNFSLPSTSRVTLDAYNRHHNPSLRHLSQHEQVDEAHNTHSDRRHTVTQTQKVVASLTGAIITSIFMTPFDVIKTRLQVQGAASTQTISFEAHLRPQTASGPSTSYHPSLPSGQRYRFNGLLDGVAKVWRSEGVGGLWRGLSPTLVMTVPSQVTYMTCYDFLRTYFLSLDQSASSPNARRAIARNAATSGQIAGTSAITLHSLVASLAAGALARSISATLVTPLELIRTRTQATSLLRNSVSVSDIIRTLAQETARDGPLVLWRGLGSTLWRDVPFSAIYFAGYEGLKRTFTGGGLGEGHASNQSAEFGISFLSGSISGSVAALFTQPADVIKTRLQTEQRAADKSRCDSVQAASCQSHAKGLPAKAAPCRSTLCVAKEIFAKEGMAGLFKGLSPRIAKVAPACGIMIASFEVVGRALASRE
ncbi:hypothetical protein V8E36_003810 [Tilletia maclaganii]